jgi:hypothetical protein
MLRKYILIVILLFLISDSCGCAGSRIQWKRKKKVDVKKPPVVLVPAEEEIASPDVSYKTHFLYWRSWQDELISVLGGNYKRQMQAAEAALSNLRKLGELLVEDKSPLLETYVTQLSNLVEIIRMGDMSVSQLSRVRNDLSRHKRDVERDFTYSHAKDWIKK